MNPIRWLRLWSAGKLKPKTPWYHDILDVVQTERAFEDVSKTNTEVILNAFQLSKEDLRLIPLHHAAPYATPEPVVTPDTKEDS